MQKVQSFGKFVNSLISSQMVHHVRAALQDQFATGVYKGRRQNGFNPTEGLERITIEVHYLAKDMSNCLTKANPVTIASCYGNLMYYCINPQEYTKLRLMKARSANVLGLYANYMRGIS